MASRTSLRILLPIFFFSGLTGLLYQIVWLKYLGLVFGNTVYAAATLIAVFLAGLGIGAFAATRLQRLRNPLLAYAAVEGAVGLIAAFSPNAFRLIDSAYIASFRLVLDHPSLLAFVRVVESALVLLPPTILMGATLPLLVRAAIFDERARPHAVAELYAANTFGATAGVAWAGFASIPRFGLLETLLTGVVINFVLATVSALLALGRKEESGLSAKEDSQQAPATWIAVASLFMGLTAIADEVFWSRILVLHLGSSVYAYSLMLFSFLTGIAIGSAVIDRFVARIDARKAIGYLELALGIALALQIVYLTRFSDALVVFARILHAGSFTLTLIALLCGVLSALLIPTAFMGATFPLTVRLHAIRSKKGEEESVGIIYLFNTIGSITGALVAGFLLIDLIGSQNGLLLMAAINIAIGAGFLMHDRRALARSVVPAAIAVALVALLVPPHAVILSAGLFEHAKIEVFREDTTATVTLQRYPSGALSLELNGVNVAGTSPDLIATQKLQGHLPLLLHPYPRSVLHIGFGSGGTAYAVSLHTVESITIAEISPEVLEVSGHHLQEVNHNVLGDPRVHAKIADGRNYVMAAPERFDVILSDSIHPRYAGNGSLYTLEYFELCRKRLNPGGVVSMWLPIYSLLPKNYLEIIKAFREVFPNTTIWYVPSVPNPFTIVIGRSEPGAIALDRLQRRISPVVARELASIGIRDAYDLTSALLIDPEGVAAITSRAGAHVDDLPTVEYESGRVIDRDGTWYQNFFLLTRARSPLSRAFTAVGDPDRIRAAEQTRLEGTATHMRILEEMIRRERQPRDQRSRAAEPETSTAATAIAQIPSPRPMKPR